MGILLMEEDDMLALAGDESNEIALGDHLDEEAHLPARVVVGKVEKRGEGRAMFF